MRSSFKSLLLLFTLSTLVGCGLNPLDMMEDYLKGLDKLKYSKSEPALLPSVKEYVENGCIPKLKDVSYCNLAYNTIINSEVGFEERTRKAGFCYITLTGKTEIIIDRKYITDKEKNKELRPLIHHELGHCHLKLEHDNSEIKLNEVKVSKSIMNSSVSLIPDLLWDAYADELFNKNVAPLNNLIVEHYEELRMDNRTTLYRGKGYWMDEKMQKLTIVYKDENFGIDLNYLTMRSAKDTPRDNLFDNKYKIICLMRVYTLIGDNTLNPKSLKGHTFYFEANQIVFNPEDGSIETPFANIKNGVVILNTEALSELGVLKTYIESDQLLF